MAKYYGQIGYTITEETTPGVWTETIVERNYYGDLVRNMSRRNSAEKVNDNIDISNSISIISDPFARDNFYSIVYATLFGTKWKVNSVDVQYPRLILSLGGLYNGEQT